MADVITEPTSEELVRTLYRVLLLREPDDAGLEGGLKLLRGGCRFEELMQGCLRSREFAENCKKFVEAYVDPKALAVTTPATNPLPRLPSGSKRNRGSPTVAGVMIAYNGGPFLSVTLPILRQCFDEMIIVDMGSTDESPALYEQYLCDADKVVLYDRRNLFQYGFSHPRNYGAKFATSDWLLAIDTDELVLPEEIAAAKSILADTELAGFSLVRRNYVFEPDHSLTALALLIERCSFKLEKHRRLYRNRPGIRFQGIIHEELWENEQNLYAIAGEIPVTIHHLSSYGKASGGNEKSQLYAFLLLRAAAYPNFKYGINAWWFEKYVPENLEVLLAKANEFAKRWGLSGYSLAQVAPVGELHPRIAR